jgi:hypothetical protein
MHHFAGYEIKETLLTLVHEKTELVGVETLTQNGINDGISIERIDHQVASESDNEAASIQDLPGPDGTYGVKQ